MPKPFPPMITHPDIVGMRAENLVLKHQYDELHTDVVKLRATVKRKDISLRKRKNEISQLRKTIISRDLKYTRLSLKMESFDRRHGSHGVIHK